MTWSRGTVILENDRISLVNLVTPIDGLCSERTEPGDERAASPIVSDTRGHRAIIEDFIQAVISDGVPLCDGHQARRSVRFVNAIYESSRSGPAVSIEGSAAQASNV